MDSTLLFWALGGQVPCLRVHNVYITRGCNHIRGLKTREINLESSRSNNFGGDQSEIVKLFFRDWRWQSNNRKLYCLEQSGVTIVPSETVKEQV